MAGQLRVRGMGKGAGAITSQMVTLHTGFPLTPGHPGITPGLDRLDFGQLLRQRLFSTQERRRFPYFLPLQCRSTGSANSRWRQRRYWAAAVNMAPLGGPVVPDVVTTRRRRRQSARPWAVPWFLTSSLPGDVVVNLLAHSQSAQQGLMLGGHRDQCRVAATQHSLQGRQQQRGSKNRPGRAAHAGWLCVLLAVADVIEWPSLGGQPRPDALNILR